MRRHLAALALLAPLTLAACGGGTDTADDASATDSPTETASTSAPEATASDRTTELQQVDAAVISATETEAGRLEIVTSIVDPRGDAGSPQAQQAIALCQAAVGILGDGAVRVAVMEEDGTTFVVYSTTPLPGDLPMGECVEY